MRSRLEGRRQPLPSISENVFNPRLGVVKKITGTLSLTGSGFRAFRGPTMNELYRQGQVGQQITLANRESAGGAGDGV